MELHPLVLPCRSSLLSRTPHRNSPWNLAAKNKLACWTASRLVDCYCFNGFHVNIVKIVLAAKFIHVTPAIFFLIKFLKEFKFVCSKSHFPRNFLGKLFSGMSLDIRQLELEQKAALGTNTFDEKRASRAYANWQRRPATQKKKLICKASKKVRNLSRTC